ncbi:EF-hand domain-containing protein [Yersinia mollaretii]|uniref:EF hand domain protein n=1 Tax=Yersinia mollaretii (strain ATCC 43969 / DSM 18520 / CIP 103324 / CNY 7263 / WAIP 204) TaxID=349967 RepID=A0ABP2EHB0_YERMW|nr:EF-hand domain-containing protein [Yersinia mollaretii]EEQ11776.1 EF hand domain protein [Yersinia mollaretii ATCC 43969]MDN0111415.1 hypothetical protein [Yersinia mollaretii]PJE86156.1 EF-hand domain-containing protein [Yersinia mollaretii]QKJ01956.1 hypothetical protein HRD69_02470 [Yersinia mollaretii ATCC 43969]CQD44288.1 Calcium-binding protein [Yersinia mollaretii]
MLTQFQIKKLTKIFACYDFDNSGFLEKSDFTRRSERRYEIAGWDPDSPQALELEALNMQHWQAFKDYADTNGDNKITLKEWLTVFDGQISGKPVLFESFPLHLQNFFEAILKSLDADGSGDYSYFEYSQLLKNFGTFDDATVKSLFEKMDINGDGSFSLTEMKHAIAEFYMSNDPDAPGNLVFGPLE